ncbi:unnamed protein product [Absidia cylindrospora]
MKVQALVLGDYGATSTFRLYRFPMPASPPLTSSPSSCSSSTSPPTFGSKPDHAAVYYYCLEDLERLSILTPISSLRHINTFKLYRDYPSAFCKNANNGYTYANTQVLYDLASLFKCSLLMDLCQLTEFTPIDQQYSVLRRIPQLDTRKLLHQQNQQSVSLLSSIGNNIHMHLVEQVLNPVRLDGQEWFLQPWIQQQKYQQRKPLIIRLSPPQEDHQHESDLSTISTNEVIHAKTKQSSLLLQRRLAPKLGHHAPHLCINTPVYKDHHLHSIRSAPLRKSISKQQINKRLQAAAAAAAAASTSTRHSHHPSALPVVPPPTSRFHKPIMAHYSPSSPSIPSSTMAATTKKQQFLQPLEHLFATLEHTQGQKTKLDDTIRHSSALMSRIQQQSSPNKVADKLVELMEAWMSPYLAQMQHCVDRLEILEEKVNCPATQQKSSETTTRSTPNDDDAKKAELLVLMRRLEHLEQAMMDTTGQSAP